MVNESQIAYRIDEYLTDNHTFAYERKGGSVPKLQNFASI